MAEVTDLDYAADAIKGTGAQWLIGDGASPENFEAVYGVRRITPGRTTTSIIDKTHLRSPDNHTEKMLGRRDSEPFEIEMIYNPDHESHEGGGSGVFQGGGIVQMHTAGTELNMKIRYGQGSPSKEIDFRGAIADIQYGAFEDNQLVMITATVVPLRGWLGAS